MGANIATKRGAAAAAAAYKTTTAADLLHQAKAGGINKNQDPTEQEKIDRDTRKQLSRPPPINERKASVILCSKHNTHNSTHLYLLLLLLLLLSMLLFMLLISLVLLLLLLLLLLRST